MKFSQKGFAPVILLIAVLMLILIGGGIYYYQAYLYHPIPHDVTTGIGLPDPLPLDETASWKTITFEKATFKIPADWFETKQLRSKKIGEGTIIFIDSLPPVDEPQPKVPHYTFVFYKSDNPAKKQQELLSDINDIFSQQAITIGNLNGLAVISDRPTGHQLDIVPGEKIETIKIEEFYLQRPEGLYIIADNYYDDCLKKDSLSQKLSCDETFDQILSTFTFLDQKSTLKTFKLPVSSMTFSYPSNWRVWEKSGKNSSTNEDYYFIDVYDSENSLKVSFFKPDSAIPDGCDGNIPTTKISLVIGNKEQVLSRVCGNFFSQYKDYYILVPAGTAPNQEVKDLLKSLN